MKGEEDVIGGGGIFFNTLQKNTHPISISNSNSKNKTSALATHLQNQFNSFLTSWTSPTKHLYLSGLYTHPSFQRRGIGTAVLNYGHEKADRESVPNFLIASAMERPLYTHKRWKEVGGVSVDLKDWVEGAEGGDAGWGVYRTGAKGNIGDEEVRG
ncbi:hypothetical protein HYALB_00011835 [Hymenoscyphus albidus]|uniref:N-acetyltransferase domain-containing protein n=1 Tax=Hymenoscyphus albidus TaxID=595503 RepID=A0A9N9LM37_9HELO|nr:hypothetical protein HYALB_00011835 [Hymenoscyphus albidus]